jgi:hypothetical protein
VRLVLLILSLLTSTLAAVAQSSSDPEAPHMTICGVRPGMTLQQVLEVLGPPVSQGPEYPLRGEEIDIWPIGWWLHRAPFLNTRSSKSCRSQTRTR